MSATATPYWKSLTRRYQLDAQAEWRKLLSHFDLSEGFALIVLLVPDADGAALCHRELETQLRHEDREMATVKITIPDDLRRLPEHFLDTPVSDNTDCLWISAVAPDYTPDYAAWRQAWEHALARLNAYRNPIRDRFECTLVFAGAPWLQEVFREIAPDLWSVRTLVVRIETAPQQFDGKAPTAPQRIESNAADAPDPQFALSQAEKLRGVAGKELVLADLLHRAGDGFAELEQWREAEQFYTEALELKQRYNAPQTSLLATSSKLAWTYLIRGEILNSLDLSEQVFALSTKISSRQGEGVALGHLGNAYAALGETRRAIECYQRQLEIVRMIGDRSDESGALSNLGLAFEELNETQRAIEYHQQALVIAHEIGDKSVVGGILGNLGIDHATLGETRRAIEYFEKALIISDEINNRHSKGSALGNLGTAYAILGEMQRANEYHKQSLDIAREIGDRPGEGNALWNMSLVQIALGEQELAIDFATAASHIFEQMKNPNTAKVQRQLEKWQSEKAIT